jgi:Outer membrane protein beta-barrel domain
MYNLLRKQIKTGLTALIYFTALLLGNKAQAQLRDGVNLPDNDDKNYHIGIVIMTTRNSFHISHNPRFIQYDSVLTVNSDNTSGFGIGGMHTFRISNRFEARVVFPQLLFVNKSITYNIKYPSSGEKIVATKNVESILLGVPIQLKLKSDRINNFRVYMMGGFKYETDLSSKAAETNAEDQVKLKKASYGIEAGMGFNFYMRYFILSPELKISNGLNNVHSRDPNLKYSNVVDKIQSRQIIFSLIFEG